MNKRKMKTRKKERKKKYHIFYQSKKKDVNGICHYWTIQAFVPDMIKRNSGNVVTVASNAAYFSLPYMSEYAASKGAAVAISNCLRLELRKMNSDVKVLVVCPAYMKVSKKN